MTIDLEQGATYGNTLTWPASTDAKLCSRKVEIQFDLDRDKFYRMFVGLMTGPTPSR